ncbi:MAG TPA: TrmH family RNA methyltransferase [Candidatus Dormibacteraeota bacterium]
MRPARGLVVQSSENEVARRIRRLAHRREPGEVLLEGPRVVREASLAGVEIELLVLRADVRRYDVPAERTVVLSERLFNSVSTTVTPQGVIAIARRDAVALLEALGVAGATDWPLIVLDGIQDPGNVGTICRTAAAAGAPAIAVLEGTADPFGPKAVRASSGNVFRLAVGAGRWEELAGRLAYGAAAEGGRALEEAPIEGAELLVLGSEAHGLRRGGLERVTIPVAEGVESLNVAAAAAVLLFEIRRRKTAGR